MQLDRYICSPITVSLRKRQRKTVETQPRAFNRATRDCNVDNPMWYFQYNMCITDDCSRDTLIGLQEFQKISSDQLNRAAINIGEESSGGICNVER